MRNAIGSVGRVYLLLLLLLVPALAQTWNQPGAPSAATGPRPDDVKPRSASVEHWVHSGPAPAATGPDYHLSFGYTHVSMPIPGVVTTNLRGMDVSAGLDFKPRWGAMLDSSFVRTANVLGTKHIGYMLSALGGPVFYPFEHGRTRPFLHFLAGVGVVDGAVPISSTSYFHGWQSRFSYAAGGGVEHSLRGPFTARFGADYLRTSFYEASGAIQPQNNFRMTVGVVIHLNRHPARTILR